MVLDTIVEMQEDDTIKTTLEELRAFIFFYRFYRKEKVYIGSRLVPEQKSKLIKIFGANSNYFVWSPIDMTGISLEMIAHKINVDTLCTPVKRKKSNQGSS